jgi:hypothetical protein
VASDDERLTRRLRLVGAATVPADARTLAACVASGRDVFAIGPTVARVQQMGHHVIERPLQPTLAAVLRDVRAKQLVALAMAPGAISWAGPAGLSALARLGLPRDTPASTAIGIVGRTDRGSDVRTGRQGVDVAWREGDVIGGRELLAPVSVGAHEDHTRVDSVPMQLATGRNAAIAVFDRGQEPALRGVASAAPGLPIGLTHQADWRSVIVRGQPRCVAASTSWTVLPASMPSLSVPVRGASAGTPALVLLGSEAQPQVAVDGLAIDPTWAASPVTVFDRQSPEGASRLRDMQHADDVISLPSLAGRWIARIELRPRGVWHAARTVVTPGVVPAGWLVRLAANGADPANVQVCAVTTAARMLLGKGGVVDDETSREIAVEPSLGWHAPERAGPEVFQWSASRTATATFALDRPSAVDLVMDAMAASTPTGRQPLSVRVNDVVVSTDWPGANRVTLPMAALRAGTNTITLSVPQAVQPGRDTRSLGVLLRQLRLIEAERR